MRGNIFGRVGFVLFCERILVGCGLCLWDWGCSLCRDTYVRLLGDGVFCSYFGLRAVDWSLDMCVFLGAKRKAPVTRNMVSQALLQVRIIGSGGCVVSVCQHKTGVFASTTGSCVDF